MSTTPSKKWWQSANFYIAVVLAIGGYFFAFPEGKAIEAVNGLFATIAGGGALYQFFKARPETKGKGWFADANFWNYTSTALVAVLPVAGPELLPSLKGVVEGLVQGNWGNIITFGLSFFTIIYKLIRGR